MRISTFTLIAILVFSSFNLSAQNNLETNPSPRFTKGYYAIGDNWKKLKPGISIPADSAINMSFSKGYYSMDTSGNKLPKKNLWFNRSPKKPVFSKGYTTIGNHSKNDN